MVQDKTSALSLTLPSDLEILMTREFDAPRELVFEALIRPEHVKCWYGLRITTLAVCEMDVRPGGSWRHVIRDADGNEFPFKGSYREVVPPERIVSTETFDVEPWSSHETVVTVTLTEHDGKTLLTSRALYQSKEARDAHIQSGMEYGAGESYDRLEEYLRAMA